MVNSGANVGGGVTFDPVAARQASVRLDALADRLERDLRVDEPALRVAPAGIDEVSVRAAQTMTDVAASFSDSADAGILELRKLAATLRSQSNLFAAAEESSVAEFGGGAGVAGAA
ncbi:PE family protein [Nocardia bovistercoris]|uniref:PE family protein n=1 Tax=Nocardia bovistercoris TaxID=2785916 RepID=A0A931IBV2_9NOCA|nr:PE family protein [Nocardia bovistercoris]MBH0777585.1 PE family protein [Nocardia bovistercoris]